MGRKIAITLGEPAGIGVELVSSLALSQKIDDCVILGDQTLIQKHIDHRELPISINKKVQGRTCLNVKHTSTKVSVELGKLNVRNSEYVVNLLDAAALGCINGEYSAMLTCPLHKGVINESGLAFTGHTEYLAQLSKTDKVVMMLLNKFMRVALVTTHLPLKEVSQNITTENIDQTLTILINDMHIKLGIENPKIAVCGLNPHAGENGHLGSEEIDIINPLICKYQEKGYKVFGAIPADTLFTVEKLKQYDAVLAMYHDQGLAPLKYAGFGKSINLTLGLPFIRTSVDHGTALDIAGKGLASADSLIEALSLTRELVKNAK